MSGMQVATPITQALNDGILTRRELKALMRRSDLPAFGHLVLWVAILTATCALIYLSEDSFWLWPAMFIHGVVLVHHFSLQHECCHYSVFKTRWLNDVIGNICGLIIMLPNRFFRYEHCDHHTYTQIRGHDTEMIEMPKTFGEYFYYLSSIPYWRAKLSEIFRHAFGHLNDVERRFIPKEEYQTIFWEARWMLIFYGAVATISFYLSWTAVIYYWLIPIILGEPVMRFIRMTEHVGKPTIADMRENTRTNYVSKPMQFLCWNMNYHAEHHYASSVPYYALPKLHQKLKAHVEVEPNGYIGAHWDIISQLVNSRPRGA